MKHTLFDGRAKQAISSYLMFKPRLQIVLTVVKHVFWVMDVSRFGACLEPYHEVIVYISHGSCMMGIILLVKHASILVLMHIYNVVTVSRYKRHSYGGLGYIPLLYFFNLIKGIHKKLQAIIERLDCPPFWRYIILTWFKRTNFFCEVLHHNFDL